ncbi:MAG: hypothetical protein JKY67_22455 [Pseudomonadales bacterium]|nr:hypothetical protein [Pseudomonadales bacterium]
MRKDYSNARFNLSNIASIVPSVFILLLLLFVIFATTAEKVHFQLYKLGAKIWTNYPLVRVDLPIPDCNPNVNVNVSERLALLEAESTDLDEDDLFSLGFDRVAAEKSIKARNALCQSKHELAKKNQAQITPMIRLYRAIEISVTKFVFFSIGIQRIILFLFIFVGGTVVTLRYQHISFRAIETQLDHRISTMAQLGCHTFMALSTFSSLKKIRESIVEVSHVEMIYLLFLGL